MVNPDDIKDGDNVTNHKGANCNILDDYTDISGIYYDQGLYDYATQNNCFKDKFKYKSFRPSKKDNDYTTVKDDGDDDDGNGDGNGNGDVNGDTKNKCCFLINNNLSSQINNDNFNNFRQIRYPEVKNFDLITNEYQCRDQIFTDASQNVLHLRERASALWDISGVDNTALDFSNININFNNNEEVGTYAKIKVCEAEPKNIFQDINPTKFIGDNVTKKGGLEGLLVLIISGLLSVFVFAIFIFAPFKFWSTYAPNSLYKIPDSKCYDGFTILDKYFAYNQRRLPYDWKFGSNRDWCYNDTGKKVTITLDKCLTDLDPTGIPTDKSFSTNDLFRKIDKLLKGFPYNVIDENLDRKYSIYNGELLFIFSALMSLTTLTTIFQFRGFWRDGWDKIWPVIFVVTPLSSVILGGLTLLMTKFYMKTKEVPKILLGILASIPVFGLLLGGIEKTTGSIVAFIACAVTFYAFIHISRLETNIPKTANKQSYDFQKLAMKILYLMRKSITHGYIMNLSSWRYIFHKAFTIISETNILPNWILIFFGSIIIPFILGIIYLIAFGRSVFWGMSGFFAKKKRTNKDSDNEIPTKGGSNIDNEPNEGGSLKTKMASAASRAASASKKAASSAASASKKAASSAAKSLAFNAKKLKEYSYNKILKEEDPDNLKYRIYGIILTVIGISISFTMIYSFFNLLLTFLTYSIVPLLYPKILATIFKCNVKYLIILFGIGMLSTMWYQSENNGVEFGLNKETLTWMTVTFVIISIMNLRS